MKTLETESVARGLLHVEARKALDITQKELSANTGVPVMWISRLESGKPGVPPKYARAVAKALGLVATRRKRAPRRPLEDTKRG